VTGVGLDLLEIDRLEQALARRPRLARRLFTDGERAFAAARGEPARHLAVLGGGDAAPSVRLSGRAAARAAALDVRVEISLTHSKGMAGAVAMLR
jgi:holo-[acyl-carrier protein] synthase